MSYWELSSGEVIVTSQEFARRLKVTRQSVYIWIARGMPVLRSLDGKILILYKEALEWVEKERGDCLPKDYRMKKDKRMKRLNRNTVPK